MANLYHKVVNIVTVIFVTVIMTIITISDITLILTLVRALILGRHLGISHLRTASWQMPCWTTSQYMAWLGNRAELKIWLRKRENLFGHEFVMSKCSNPPKDDFLTPGLAVENWKLAIMGSNLKIVMRRTQREKSRTQMTMVLHFKNAVRDHSNFSLESNQ